jgi:hypothetical protein
MNHMNSTSACSCVHHKIWPILIIIFGAIFLFGNLGYLSAEIIRIAWPSTIILIGLVKLGSGSCKCYEKGA